MTHRNAINIPSGKITIKHPDGIRIPFTSYYVSWADSEQPQKKATANAEGGNQRNIYKRCIQNTRGRLMIKRITKRGTATVGDLLEAIKDLPKDREVYILNSYCHQEPLEAIEAEDSYVYIGSSFSLEDWT